MKIFSKSEDIVIKNNKFGLLYTYEVRYLDKKLE